MKIILISPFQNRLYRGVETVVDQLAANLERLNHTVVIYAWVGNIKSESRQRLVPFYRYFQRFISALYYRFWLKIDKPDAVVLNFWYHGEQWLPKHLNFVTFLHFPASINYARYKNLNAIFPKNKLVAVSDYVKEEALPFISNHNCNIIQLGVDNTKFNPQNIDFKIQPKNQVHFISASALEPRKNIDIFINFLFHVNQPFFFYHVFGDGAQRLELNTLINNKKLGSCVFINTPIKHIELEYSKSHIYVCFAEGEAFGLAWLEAAASGLPILAAKIEPYISIMNESFCCFVDINDNSSIANGIDKICANYEQYSRNSIAFAKQHSWEKVAIDLVNLISKN